MSFLDHIQVYIPDPEAVRNSQKFEINKVLEILQKIIECERITVELSNIAKTYSYSIKMGFAKNLRYNCLSRKGAFANVLEGWFQGNGRDFYHVSERMEALKTLTIPADFQVILDNVLMWVIEWYMRDNIDKDYCIDSTKDLIDISYGLIKKPSLEGFRYYMNLDEEEIDSSIRYKKWIYNIFCNGLTEQIKEEIIKDGKYSNPESKHSVFSNVYKNRRLLDEKSNFADKCIDENIKRVDTYKIVMAYIVEKYNM